MKQSRSSTWFEMRKEIKSFEICFFSISQVENKVMNMVKISYGSIFANQTQSMWGNAFGNCNSIAPKVELQNSTHMFCLQNLISQII
jgi:hypothetical protein